MGKVPQVGRIQVEQDLRFLRREWRVQRLGWLGLGITILAALLGVFGRGPLAHARVGDPQVFAFEFDRIARAGALTRLTALVGPGLQSDSLLRLSISRDYAQSILIETIVPEPVANELNGDYIVFTFERVTRRAPARITFHIRPRNVGQHHVRIGLADVAALEFGQFVLP